jgi:hypothetical protein
MDKKEILENLCYYDKRNPNAYGIEERKPKKCFCDNCCYGRTKLANELLKYIK